MTLLLPMLLALPWAADHPFQAHGALRIAESRTHLEHADGTPFFFLADTCWSGPALSTAEDWQKYLKNRKAKGFTAIQFNMVSPWRAAPTDASGRTSYTVRDGQLTINQDYYQQLDQRIRAINDAGLLAVPVLCWAHRKGDAGVELSEEHITELIRFELDRYKDIHALWILAGDNRYTPAETEKWKRIGRAVFAENKHPLVTTHPTGMNWPWQGWQDESWLTVLGYQSGHGDGEATCKWIHSGPAAEYGRTRPFLRPVINLEPPYEAHNAYQSRKPHTDFTVRRAVYWSLLSTPIAGITYGGQGVWSWHTRPGEEPTDHKGSGVAKLWHEAIDLPGATQMGYARKLMESLPWTELRPAQDLIAQQPGTQNAEHHVACAATPDGKTVVAYTPRGGKIVLKGEKELAKGKGSWFNPRTGETQPASAPWTTPDEHDWILVLRP